MSTLQLSLMSLTIAMLFIQYSRTYIKLDSTKAALKRAETRAETAERSHMVGQQDYRQNTDAMKREIYRLEQTAKHDRAFIKELTQQNKREQALRDTLTAIKFHARVPSYSGHQKTEFKLGLGPCGLTVDKLLFSEDGEKFTITQICTNGERKTFDYYKEDVAGRIEKRWAA